MTSRTRQTVQRRRIYCWMIGDVKHRTSMWSLLPVLSTFIVLLAVILVSACSHPGANRRASDSGGYSNQGMSSAAAADGHGNFWDSAINDATFAEFPPVPGWEQLRQGGERVSGSVYTFVLFGDGEQSERDSRHWRHKEVELLRLIDTYVIDDGPGVGSRHRFLVPVYAGLDSLPLGERSAPELSDPALRDLAAGLSVSGRDELSARLRAGDGPFLVSQTGPDWQSAQAQPLLIADLTNLGAEHLYPLVDAYDQPVASLATGGTANRLVRLRDRLRRLVSASPSTGSRQWLFLVEPLPVGGVKDSS